MHHEKSQAEAHISLGKFNDIPMAIIQFKKIPWVIIRRILVFQLLEL